MYHRRKVLHKRRRERGNGRTYMILKRVKTIQERM
jgi:hypothetical protein